MSISRLLDDFVLVLFVLSSFLAVAFAIYERASI
jgi:hypothetical protein